MNRMKKLIAILLVLMMVLAVAACGKDDDKKDSENYSTLTETELTESSGFAFSFGAKATIGFSYMF